MERLFIIQHGLVDLHAHYYGETLGWLAACRKRGISPRFYVKRGALPQIVLELGAKPVFPYAPDEIISQDPIGWQLSDFMTLSTGFAEACKTLESDGVGGDDLVVLPFATERCVFGAAQWLQRLSQAARPAMAFNFLVPDLNWHIEDDRSRVSGEFSFFRYATRRIRELLPPSKLFFSSAVFGLCNALAEATQYPCREVPLGTSFPSEKKLAAYREKLPRAHIGVFGEFRPERGSEIVSEVLLQFAELRPKKSIAVHVINEAQAMDFRRTVRERGARSPFFVYYGHTDPERFLRRLISTDILLLPYNWKRYAIRPSNVFSEAAGYGVVVVVPDRTWAADKLAEGHGAGTIFRDFSVEAMIEALLTASDQYRELKALAEAKKLVWRQSHSTAALLDNILGQVASPSSSKRGDAPVRLKYTGTQTTGRWHIMDCGLRSDVGHHLYQSLAIAAELRKRKIPARFVINAAASPRLIPSADVIPLFRAIVYETVSTDTICGEYEDFISLNRMTVEDLTRIDVKSFTRDDTVLFPATIYNQLLGILQWAETLAPAALPRIVVVLMFPPDYTPAPWRTSAPAMYYRYAWKSCAATVRERLYLCADNEPTARGYESILGFRPTLLPPPIAGWEMGSAVKGKRLAQRGSGERLISYLGHGRHEKGFHLLPDALRHCAVSRLPARFFVQAWELVEPGLAEVEDRLATESGVQIHRGAMERNAYYSVLAASDLTLLPYDPACYRTRGSMIYFEATVIGIPVIVPADTWMGRDVIEHGNGIAFTSFTPEAIALAIADALAQVKKLRGNALRYAAQLRPHRGIDAYIDCVLRLGMA